MNNSDLEISQEFSGQLKVFMESRSWKLCECQSCRRAFYSKNLEASECGWRKCSSADKEKVRNAVLSKKQISLLSLLQKIKSLFISLGYTNHEPIAMTSGYNTDLVSAGVQIFSDIFSSRDSSGKGGVRYFVSQPCVRLGSLRSKEDKLPKDMSTSFVNTCTESLGITLDDHFTSMDHWLTVLSKLGLHASNLNLIIRNRLENWGMGEFLVHQVFFVYNSVEIGDANFTYSLPGNSSLSMSDIGFGLERICWVLNGLSDYSDVSSILGLPSDPELQDACRTIALLLTSKVTPSGRSSGGRLRWLIKRATLRTDAANVVMIVYSYLGFWKQFNKSELNYSSMLEILMPECDHGIIKDLCLRFGVNQHSKLSLIELIEILVYNRGQDPKFIKELISNKKNENK